ncbi:MAG: hypothetical protein LAN84_09730 [Acidobacteriia bacterium]|nr:hypothetical protein [Terriglobia bacterium]
MSKGVRRIAAATAFTWILAAMAFFFALRRVRATEEARVYHPVTIAQMAADNPAKWAHVHTHVEITGWATFVKLEADSDIHIRICDSAAIKTMDRTRCVVAECIPEIPCAAPRVGQRVKVRGIYRFDAENRMHNWAEIHPVEKLEVLK